MRAVQVEEVKLVAEDLSSKGGEQRTKSRVGFQKVGYLRKCVLWFEVWLCMKVSQREAGRDGWE